MKPSIRVVVVALGVLVLGAVGMCLRAAYLGQSAWWPALTAACLVVLLVLANRGINRARWVAVGVASLGVGMSTPARWILDETSPVVFVPPVLAMLFGSRRAVVLAGVGTWAVVVARGSGHSPYLESAFLIPFGVLLAALVLARRVIEDSLKSARRASRLARVEHRRAQAERARAVSQSDRDRTERRSLQAQLIAAQRLESVGRLAAGVAHDFNNVLTVVTTQMSFIQALLPREHPAHAGLHEVWQATRRATALTRQLFAFARCQVLERTPADLNDIVSDLQGLLATMMGRGVELKLELTEQPAVVRVDVSQIEQVLMNLALNARDAMGGEGAFFIRTERREAGPGAPAVVLVVSDTGEGMSEEILRQAFDPFFTTKAESGGTGLGLATTYGIVRQHGGTIRCDSAPGQGTRFEIHLPVVNGDSVTIPLRRSSHPPPRRSSRPPPYSAPEEVSESYPAEPASLVRVSPPVGPGSGNEEEPLGADDKDGPARKARAG